MEVTDQGQRRPTKVARLVPPGTRSAVAQLIAPKLVWFKNWQFVLTGIEELADPNGRIGVAQAWLCKLALPAGTASFKATHTHNGGVEVPKRMLSDRFTTSNRGLLAVATVMEPALARHTTRAEMARVDGMPGYPSPSLIDCELEWMSQDRFAISGLEQRNAFEERPAALLRQGWLCQFDLIEQAQDESRPLRNAKPTSEQSLQGREPAGPAHKI